MSYRLIAQEPWEWPEGCTPIPPGDARPGDIVLDYLGIAIGKITGEGHHKLFGECWTVEIVSPPFARGQQSLMSKDNITQARRVGSDEQEGVAA